MPVSADIYNALGVRPKSMMDYQNEYNQADQNALALKTGQVQYQNALQSQQDMNALRSAAQNFGADPQANYQAILKTGNVKAAQDYLTSTLGNQKTQAETTKFGSQSKEADAKTAQLAQATALQAHVQHIQKLSMVNDPQGLAQWAQEGQAKGVLDPSDMQAVQQVLPQVGQNPQALQDFKAKLVQSGLKPEELMKFTTPDANARLSSATQIANNQATNQTHLQSTAMTNATSRANNQATIAKDLKIADPLGSFGLNPTPPSGAANPVQGANGDAYLSGIPAPLAAQVKALAEGRMAFPTGMALKSPYWQNMLSAVGQYDPSFDAVNYNARSNTRKDFTSGKAAQNLNAFNTVLGHLDTLVKSGEALNNTSYPLYNKAANFVAQNTGDPRVQQFNANKKAVVDELTRAWRGAGGSEGDIKTWSSVIDAANSPDQLHGVASDIADLLHSKIDAMGEQYKQGMGTASGGIQLLTPKSQAFLDKLRGVASKQAPAGSAVVPPDIAAILQKHGGK